MTRAFVTVDENNNLPFTDAGRLLFSSTVTNARVMILDYMKVGV